jgi:hypothetical protein
MADQAYGLSRVDGIEAKLNRAEQQIGVLKESTHTWSTRACALEPEVNEGKRRYIWTFVLYEPIPPTPAVISDEIIHHLRSVLDHLASHLVESCGGQPGRAAWPFEGSHWGWRRNVERRQHPWQLWRKGGGGPLAGIPRGSPVWTFIESTQPHKSGRKARDDLLFGLNDAWNANKHRILNALWFEAKPEGDPIDLFEVTPAIEPVESRWIIGPGDLLHHGTKIAIFYFPETSPLPEMQVRAELLPVQIAMGDGKGPEHNLEKTLEVIRGLVASGIALAPPSR